MFRALGLFNPKLRVHSFPSPASAASAAAGLLCCCTFRMSWGQAETSKRNGYSPLQSMYISSQMYVDGGSICQAAGAHGLHVAFVLCAAADCFTFTCVKLPCLN